MADDETLKSMFKKAIKKIAELHNSVGAVDASHQSKVVETVLLLEKCRDMIDKLALFSVNESSEDIGSNDLAFLLLESYLAQTTLMQTNRDRQDIIDKAQNHFNAFLEVLVTHELLNKSDFQHWQAIQQGVKSNDPVRLREEKIARFKREKATVEKMQELEELGDEDDEMQRELAITTIDLHIQRALEELASLREELKMLEYMKRLKTDDEVAYQQSIKEQQRSRGPNKTGPLMNGDGKVSIMILKTNTW
jgi:immunoglobulin-binding protein 1